MKKGAALEIKAASLKGNELDRLLFARRLLAGDGTAAEGMPAKNLVVGFARNDGFRP